MSAVLIFATAFVVWNYLRPEQILPACVEPITYNIGTFDRKFGISYRTFLSALVEAEAIWEKPIGKELFVYEPESGELAVNLIYDYRQETTGTLSGLENIVAKDELAYQAMRAKYINLKTDTAGPKVFMIRVLRYLMKETPLIKNRLNLGIEERELLENSSINWK